MYKKFLRNFFVTRGKSVMIYSYLSASTGFNFEP